MDGPTKIHTSCLPLNWPPNPKSDHQVRNEKRKSQPQRSPFPLKAAHSRKLLTSTSNSNSPRKEKEKTKNAGGASPRSCGSPRPSPRAWSSPARSSWCRCPGHPPSRSSTTSSGDRGEKKTWPPCLFLVLTPPNKNQTSAFFSPSTKKSQASLLLFCRFCFRKNARLVLLLSPPPRTRTKPPFCCPPHPPANKSQTSPMWFVVPGQASPAPLTSKQETNQEHT